MLYSLFTYLHCTACSEPVKLNRMCTQAVTLRVNYIGLSVVNF